MKTVLQLLVLLGISCTPISSVSQNIHGLISTVESEVSSSEVMYSESSPDLIPYTLFDDFETGEKFGWETYPYEQDVGTTRHFFTRKSPTYNDSEYALQRPFRANDALEAYNGFTKRLNMWTTPETRVRVAIFLQGDRNADKLELSLGTFDGRRYMHTILDPKANQWLELDIPLSDFEYGGKSLTEGEHLQVVTVKSSYSSTYYLNSYTIVMDDFQITGARQRRFVGTVPESSHFELLEVSVLNKHFFYGDTIVLKVLPEDGSPVTQVRGELLDGYGDVVLDNIPFILRDGEWINDNIYQLSEDDARGQWEILLTGQTEGGAEISWGLKFLMPGNPVTGHPRLFFSSDELQQRLENEQSPVAKRILENALADTDFMNVNIDEINQWEDTAGEALAGGPFGKYSFGFGGFGQYRNPMNRLGNIIRDGSFRYAFTGDREAGEKAKEALLKLSSFTQWSPNWMLDVHNLLWYPVGYILKPVAYGYDMLHDILTEEERKLVRDAIMEKGLKLFHRDMVEMNRMPSNVTNHIAVLASGHGLAATAIYGEDPDNPYLEPYLSGIIAKAKTFIDRTYYDDGSYGEPYSYMDMASRSLIEITATFERNFGVDWSTTTDMKNFYKYPIQATHSSGLIHSWGDTGRNYAGFNQIHSMWFVHRLGNPYVYNYIKPYWEEGNGGYMGYLWYRDDITPISRETLPTSEVFKARGMVLRSGWEDESTIITTRIGPNSNHYHYDMGSFQIMTNGEELLTDPGIGRGGYYGGRFVVYDIHAIAHNVMLLDHDAESQAPAHYDIGIAALEDWPRMVHTFTGEIADAVEGDLAIVYKDKLEKYTRTLLYTKSGPLFLFDSVKSKSTEGHVFNWQFHAPQNEGNTRSISYNDGRLMIERPNARLTMDVLSPDVVLTRIYDNNDERFPESFATLSTATDHMDRITEADFFAVILPEAKPEAGTYDTLPVSSRIDAPGWIGAKVERPGFIDFGFFRTGDDASDTINGFTTDATRFTATCDGSEVLQKAYFEGSSFSGKGLTVQSNTLVTLAISSESSGMDIEVNSDEPAELKISWMQQRPARILMNGETTNGWSYDSGSDTLTLSVPEGRNNLSVN